MAKGKEKRKSKQPKKQKEEVPNAAGKGKEQKSY